MAGQAGLILSVLAVVVLAWLYRRDARLERQRRALFFDHCLDLVDSGRVTRENRGYPVMEAKYRGYDVRLEPVLDTIAWRKIPSLWLKVTVLAPNPVSGVLDLLVRPRGTEFYSPSDELDIRVAVPSGWPKDAIICTRDRATMPRLDQIAPHIHLFDDPRMKELVVTPSGTRLVYQAMQAERAYYLVLRQARFAEPRLDPKIASRLLDAAIAISRSLAAGERIAA
jgi:hypothetical protein